MTAAAMTATARALAYLAQTGRPRMTPAQARRYRRKIFRGARPRLDATPPAARADATAGGAR